MSRSRPLSLVVRQVVAVAGVSLRRVLLDRMAVFFILIFPLLLVLVLGSAFGGESGIHVGLVAPDDDELAAEVVATLDDEDDLRARRYGSEADLMRAVERGAVAAGVVIPDGYSEQLSAGDDVTVAFMARPGTWGETARPVVLRAVSEQSVRLQAARFASEQTSLGFSEALRSSSELAAALENQSGGLGVVPITTRVEWLGEALFPESLGQFDLGASQMLLLFMFVNGLASSTVLIQNRRLGVARRMLAAPMSARMVMAGEGLGQYCVVAFQGLYIMVATTLLFGVNWGNLPAALTVVMAFGLVATAAAMLAGSLFSNDQQAGSVGVVLGLGLAALGGSMAPMEVFSPLMRDIAHVTPHAWGNDAFATLVRNDGGVGDIWLELAVLAAAGLLLAGLASRRLHRTLTST